MKQPTFISLFAGIGGIDLGLERAGFECVAQVEWDSYCTEVLTKHWPSVPKFQDIKDVTSEQLRSLGPVDLVAGGFPCQPVSVAGRQKAQADDRWLWPEFARVIRTVRPRVVFVENVPGLLTANSGEAFSEVQSDLASLGYDTEWEVIPASAFGAPHLRKRVVLIAYSVGEFLRNESGWSGRPSREGRTFPRDNGTPQPVADTCCQGRAAEGAAERRETQSGRAQCRPIGCGVHDRVLEPAEREAFWAVEPDVGRVAHGVPRRMDRLKALGNAVVPQFSEYVGRQIMREFFT